MISTQNRQFHTIDCVILMALVAVVYGRILGHDFQSNWDDNWFVLFDDSIRGFSWGHIRQAFSSFVIGQYAPLQSISFMLDYTLWGLWPGGFLLTNLILHAINGILIYLLFIRWYRDRLFALLASALFLLHPVQVESVAWVSQRKNLLAMFFFILAWMGYCRYRDAEAGRGRLAYLASVTAFFLALSAKAIAVVFPLVLVFYDICFSDAERRLRLKDKLPFILAAGVIAVVTLQGQGQVETGGTRVGFHGGSPLATFYTMLPVFCRYLGMVVWPAGLSSNYATAIHPSVDAAVAGAALLLGGVLLAGVLLYKVDKRKAFWVLFFFIGLLPVSQIVPLLSISSDCYLYFPMLGVAALGGSGAVALRERLWPQSRVLLCALLMFPLLALSVVTYQRTGDWRDSLTLWSDAVAKEPASDKAWEILGLTYKDSGKTEAARHALERGLGLNPSNTEIMSGLGDLYTETGELDKGYIFYKKLLDIKPTYVSAWAGLGDNYMKRGDYIEAEKSYKRAYSLQPEAVQVVSRLGNLAMIQGLFSSARNYYLQAESKNGGVAEIAYNLACAEAASGRNDAALAWLEKAFMRGFGDYQLLVGDIRLAALRSDPRFARLLQHYFP